MPFRIGTRLILGASLTTALVIGIMAITVQRAHTSQFVFERTRSANQLSEVIQQSTRVDMLENQRERLHEQIRTLGSLSEEGIRKVRLFNKEGRIMFSSDQGEIGTSVDKRGEACYACHAEGRPLEKLDIQQRARRFMAADGTPMLGMIAPILNAPSCSTAACHAHSPQQRVLGVLDVNLSLAEAELELHRSQRILFTMSVLAIVATAGMLAWLTRKLVVKPVDHLLEGTRRLSAGDLGHTIPAGADHELGDLARAFNDMSHRLVDTQLQLAHADKLASVGRLAAGVAHEINNPLTGVLSYASLLQKRLSEDPEAREDLEVVVRETKRCREIVRQLLDFARPTPPKRRRVDVHEIVRHAAAVLHNQLEMRAVALQLDLASDLPALDLDPGQIEQVLVNLILNALDAHEEDGGEIQIRTSRIEEDWIDVEVMDSGRGISSADLPRLFEPFFTTKGTKGTGLGLAVTWGIIRGHGGTITVESEPGHGAAFRIRLPLAAPAGEPMLSMPLHIPEEKP